LWAEAFEISEEPVVYSFYEAALESAKKWEDFLGMPLKEALEYGEIAIQKWILV
jgi:hypothetical protein